MRQRDEAAQEEQGEASPPDDEVDSDGKVTLRSGPVASSNPEASAATSYSGVAYVVGLALLALRDSSCC